MFWINFVFLFCAFEKIGISGCEVEACNFNRSFKKAKLGEYKPVGSPLLVNGFRGNVKPILSNPTK